MKAIDVEIHKHLYKIEQAELDCLGYEDLANETFRNTCIQRKRLEISHLYCEIEALKAKKRMEEFYLTELEAKVENV